MKKEKMLTAIGNIDDNLILDAAKETKSSKFGGWKTWAIAAAALLLIATTAFSAGTFFARGKTPVVAATIALDVNPSMEIEVDAKERVINVNPLNEDAQVVIDDMDLKNVQLDVVINAIIGSMLQHGYLSTDNNSILISVASNDRELSAKLQNEVSAKVNEILSSGNIEPSILTQSYDKKQQTDTSNNTATKNQVSAAKETLIGKILDTGLTDAHNRAYSYEELIAMNIHELKMILEAKNLELQGTSSSGQASTNAYITKEQALTAAYAHADLDVASVVKTDVELDYEYGTMVYEIDIDTETTEYEFEINAATGTVISFKKEARDLDDLNDKYDELLDDIYDDDKDDDWDDRFDDDDD